ncbi:unannotated protein [freshwater metagenome]|uniref:Unannotated protein n=1 Tax=freshwater metagenome TaxID=449393 RepID=A0A6J6UFM6_9ZZZZ|nr:hypothetical protein [Actinomycetota bacterium]
MGFWNDLFGDPKGKKEKLEVERLHKEWSEDVATLAKLKEAFIAVQDGEDAESHNMIKKDGEFVIWAGVGQFHEAGRTAGQYVGSSQGFSIPVVAGIRYRVGAQRGTFIPGEEIQVYKDTGQVYLTTDRLVFNGLTNTAEWKFDKWIGAGASPDGGDFIFHVSNRKKSSGILFDKDVGEEFNRFLAFALIHVNDGLDRVMKEIKGLEERIPTEEPKLLKEIQAPKGE